MDDGLDTGTVSRRGVGARKWRRRRDPRYYGMFTGGRRLPPGAAAVDNSSSRALWGGVSSSRGHERSRRPSSRGEQVGLGRSGRARTSPSTSTKAELHSYAREPGDLRFIWRRARPSSRSSQPKPHAALGRSAARISEVLGARHDRSRLRDGEVPRSACGGESLRTGPSVILRASAARPGS